jgi:hypothetical protein
MSPKSKPKKKKIKQSLSQNEKFIACAKKVGVDEDYETFMKTLRKIIKKK